LFAFPIIFLLSLLFFCSLVASLLPPFLGVLAILLTFFALRIVSSFTDLSVFALNIVTGLGLGLAIDYSLFTVSRYREEAARTGFGVYALRRTLATSGRTILVGRSVRHSYRSETELSTGCARTPRTARCRHAPAVITAARAGAHVARGPGTASPEQRS
jgi:hypothetical protein